MDSHVHTKQQKDKARKRGASVKNKCLELGEHCNIFAAVVYWEPTHKRMEAVMHIPEHQTAPDFNEIFSKLTGVDYQLNATRKRVGSAQRPSNAKKQRLDQRVTPNSEEGTEQQPRRTSERLRARGSTREQNEEEASLEDNAHVGLLREDGISGLPTCEFNWLEAPDILVNDFQSQNIMEPSSHPDLLCWSSLGGIYNQPQRNASKRAPAPTRLARRVIKLLEELVPKRHL
ncbi:hypothetical protein TruAng_011726 [Truncatella angustata]|nr:hypothetical protein TruAng_011726 [Truncatella angustata]